MLPFVRVNPCPGKILTTIGMLTVTCAAADLDGLVTEAAVMVTATLFISTLLWMDAV